MSSEQEKKYLDTVNQPFYRKPSNCLHIIAVFYVIRTRQSMFFSSSGLVRQTTSYIFSLLTSFDILPFFYTISDIHSQNKSPT